MFFLSGGKVILPGKKLLVNGCHERYLPSGSYLFSGFAVVSGSGIWPASLGLRVITVCSKILAIPKTKWLGEHV
jgi:hypothetical protein